MTDSPDQAEAPKTLAEILLEKNLLSQAQIELAIADQDINDIPLEEILLVRGWISQDKLFEVAPWLVPGSQLPAPPISKSGAFAKPGSGKTGSFSKPDLSKLAAMKPNAEQGTAAIASFSAKDGVVTGGTGAVPEKETPPSASASSTTKDSDKAAAPSSDKSQASPASNNNNSEKNAQSTNGADKAAELPPPPVSTAGSDDLNKSQDIPLVAGTVSGGANRGASKPGDTKEPPLNAHANPEVHVSPVKSDNEQNLKAYKDVLKKILALDKD